MHWQAASLSPGPPEKPHSETPSNNSAQNRTASAHPVSGHLKLGGAALQYRVSFCCIAKGISYACAFILAFFLQTVIYLFSWARSQLWHTELNIHYSFSLFIPLTAGDKEKNLGLPLL